MRQIDRTYDVAKMRDTLREALTTKEKGPKVIVASSECMLNKQRRVKPLFAQGGRSDGERMVQASASASTRTSAPATTPASASPAARRCRSSTPTIRCKDDPVAAIDNSCVGCGNCGEVAEAAVLCPSFYRADIIHNPTGWDRFIARLRGARHRLAAAPPRAGASSSRCA